MRHSQLRPDRLPAVPPPLWIRLLFVPVFALLIYGVNERRGLALTVVAVVVYGGICLATILRPRELAAWSHAHPRADGAGLGPISFLALVGVTPLSVGWCLLGGALGLVAGIALGARRGRLAARQVAVAEAEAVDADAENSL